MHRSAEDGAAGGGVALLASLFLLGAAATLVVGLLVPQWGLMMMALSVALSGAAFASRAMRDDGDRPRPAPGPTSGPAPRPTGWDMDPRRTLEGAALTLPPNLFEVLGRGSVTPPDEQRKAVESRLTEEAAQDERTSAAGDVVEANAGPPDAGSSQGALVPVAWGSGVQPAAEASPDLQHLESAILARVVAEGEIIRAEVRELHDRLRASLLADLDQIASDQPRGREGLADEIEQLHERSTTVLNEVRQLSEQYRQARDGLAGAVRQTATWLVKSRDELYERLDSVSRMVERAGSSRDDMQELRDDVTQALALQRMDYAEALAAASADRGASERLSTRLDEQAGLAAETLEQQKQLREKLDAVSRLTEEARSSWRGGLEELREDVVQAVVDQRVDYANALAVATADRGASERLSTRLDEQAGLASETLEQQKQLREKLDAVTRLTEEARSSWRGDLEALREDVVQAVVDQRTDYGSAVVEASARDRATLDPLSHLVQEQSALLAETLQEQKQLHSEVASLRAEIAQAPRSTPRALRPVPSKDEPRATAGSVPHKVQSSSSRTDTRSAITRRPRGRLAEVSQSRAEGPLVKRSAAKKAAGATGAAATKAPAAKAAVKASAANAAKKASPAKKAPPAKAATKAATKAPPAKAAGKAAPAKVATKAPPAKATTKAVPAKAATKAATKAPPAKAAPAKAAKAAPAKAVTRASAATAATKASPAKAVTKAVPAKASPAKAAPANAATKATPAKAATKTRAAKGGSGAVGRKQ